jgi:hypothetical protein
MGKNFVCALAMGTLMLLGATSVQAETFLLILAGDDAVGSSVPPAMLSAVEDGAYDVFFEARHICFNDGIWNKEYPLSAPQGLERAMKLAREGGATKVLILSLAGTGEGEKTFRPETVAYALYRVLDRRRLATGSVKAELKVGITADGKQEPEELCAELGRQAVRQALSESK